MRTTALGVLLTACWFVTGEVSQAQVRIRVPFVDVDTSSGSVWVGAPFVGVYTGGGGTRVWAPFTYVETGVYAPQVVVGAPVYVEVAPGAEVVVPAPAVPLPPAPVQERAPRPKPAPSTPPPPQPVPESGKGSPPREVPAVQPSYLVLPPSSGRQTAQFISPRVAAVPSRTQAPVVQAGVEEAVPAPTKPARQVVALAPMRHTDLRAVNLQPAGGIHLFAFVHPYTRQSVGVQVTLPPGRPRLDIRFNEVEFDYGDYEVEVHFYPNGSVRVRYDD